MTKKNQNLYEQGIILLVVRVQTGLSDLDFVLVPVWYGGKWLLYVSV